MLDFIYCLVGIIVTIIFSYVTFRCMKKIKNVKIDQSGRKLKDIKGADFHLTNDGEDLLIKDIKISQEAEEMENVIGLSFKAKGKQAARLQDVEIERPNAKVVISKNPQTKVIINGNKQ